MSATKPHIAASFHHSYLEAIRNRTAPTHVLAEIIVKRLCKQGVDGTKHFDYIKQSISQALTSGTSDDLKNFQLDLDDGNPDFSPIPLELDSGDVDEAVKKIEDALESASQEMFASFSESALKSVLKSPSERLLHETNERDAFGRRLEFTWAQAFRLLDVQISLCIEIGAARNDWLRKKAAALKGSRRSRCHHPITWSGGFSCWRGPGTIMQRICGWSVVPMANHARTHRHRHVHRPTWTRRRREVCCPRSCRLH